jgi:signal recognition particle receptor subunit beta
MVIGITHTDLQPQRPLGQYLQHLKQRGCKVSDALPPVLEMDARNKKHVHTALVAMTAQLEMAERYPKVAAGGARQ